MALGTYTELTEEVIDLLSRYDLAGKVPVWIALVEAELQRVLKGRDMRVILPVVFSAGDTFAIPGDLNRAVSLTLETSRRYAPVEITTYERLQSYQGQFANTAGLPLYGAIVGSTLFLCPTPDADYTGTLIYDAELTPLTEDAPINWAITKHPDLYLYGCAFHSAPYLKNEERMPMWRQLYQTALDQIQQVRDEVEFGPNTPIIRPRSTLGE